MGRKAQAPTIVLSIRIPATWLESFGLDKEAAAMYAKSALERVATGGIGNFVRRDLTGEIMNIAEELRAQANQHPLDADLEMFNVAATRIEALESALIQMADANSNWAMNMDDKTVDAIHHLIVQAQTA
mgnify:CR=1 FL=1